MRELKEVAKTYNIKLEDIYRFMNTKRQNVDYLYKNNKDRYFQFVNEFVLRYNDIKTNELIKMIDLYKVQKEKLQDQIK